MIHAADEKICEKCGEAMIVIGKEKVRDELVYVPTRLFVRRHFAEVMKCTSCSTDESRDEKLAYIEACTIRQASVPAPMIPHSYCSPELLAHIIYEKYCNAVPLERQAKDLTAKGVKILTATLANWVIYAANVFLKQIYAKMKEELLEGNVIHADEAVVQVLHEPAKMSPSLRIVYFLFAKNDSANKKCAFRRIKWNSGQLFEDSIHLRILNNF